MSRIQIPAGAGERNCCRFLLVVSMASGGTSSYDWSSIGKFCMFFVLIFFGCFAFPGICSQVNGIAVGFVSSGSASR